MRNLPGTIHAIRSGEMCDEHTDVVAYRKVQGETDSFGAEYHLMCYDCYDAYEKAKREAGPKLGCCDLCSGSNVEVAPWRDWEEGSNGPVYQVCKPCRQRRAEIDAAEIAEDEGDDHFYEDSEDDYYPEDDFEPEFEDGDN